MTTPGEPVGAELFEEAGSGLRVVANHAVGFDNVDLAAATARGIVVTNTPGVLTSATAELTLALMLALLRRVPEGDRMIRRAETWAWGPTFMLGRGLAGLMLGIVGFGRIGREVGRLAAAFGMDVVHSSRTSGLSLDELLGAVDVVSLHAPLTPETHGLIDAAALRRMKPSAVLVNTSRGALVDERALAGALERSELAGAALDVYEREPEVEERLLRLENVVLAPHLGSATVETREAMGLLCVESLRVGLLEGRCPPRALNPEAWGLTP